VKAFASLVSCVAMRTLHGPRVIDSGRDGSKPLAGELCQHGDDLALCVLQLETGLNWVFSFTFPKEKNECLMASDKTRRLARSSCLCQVMNVNTTL